MIGLRKSLLKRAAKKKTVIFDRFASVPALSSGAAAMGTLGGGNNVLVKGETLCAKSLKNCDVTGNVLRRGIGAKFFLSKSGNTLTGINASTLNKILRVNMKADNAKGFIERFLMVFNDGYVRLYDESERGFTESYLFGANTKGVLLRAESGEERYLIAGESGSRFLKQDGTLYETDFTKVRHALCVCKNRLFIAQTGGKLLYSDPLTPWEVRESIHDGGYIQMPVAYGEPIDLIAVGDCVYVLYQRAILCVSVRGSGKEFRVEETFYTGAKILVGSGCPTADGLVFLATDGLWRLNGLKAERICKNLPLNVYLQSNTCNAVVFGEKYLLRYQSDNGTLRSVVVDLAEENYYDCYDLVGLSGGADVPIFLKGNLVYQLGETVLPSGEKSSFESVDLDFGIVGKKTLRRVTLVGEGGLTLSTYCDGVCVQRSVELESGRADVDLDLRGENFSFAIELKSKSSLRSLCAEIVW